MSESSGMSRQQRLVFWLAMFAIFVFLVWLLRSVLLPFVAGGILAFFLDPATDRLERVMPRWAATILILILFLVVCILAVLLFVPLLVSQITGLISALPNYTQLLDEFFRPAMQWLQERLGEEQVQQLRESAASFVGDALAVAASVVTGVLRSGVAFLNLLSLLIITPVVAFYLLRDWDRLVATVDDHLPHRYQPTIRRLASEVNGTLQSFLIGQATVCLILGVAYAVALSIVGLNFGLVIGLIAGALTFIPYVGSLVGFILSVGIALLQFDDWVMWLVVAAIFFAGQAVEGNFLTPKLVGSSVGLHAVWIIFALMAGGALFGFTGVLLAVPVAAVIGVLIRFFLQRYRESSLYLDDEPADGAGKAE
ncbi:MAG: AI-2E family transporter [Pseudomonadota bacterium]